MRYLVFLTIFLMGFVVCANLSMLIETNDLYDAQWWKVWAFSAMASVVAFVNA